ncbi:MAG: BlaI/MecI/CopY family transcriptional regulator [Cyclobacteriaceae bacterium]
MDELTKAEEQIMRVVWKEKKIFIKELVDKLPGPKPAYNTVGTFLKILEKKGFVDRRKYGSSFEYSPRVKRSNYLNFIMRGFLSRYFDGSTENMLSYFMENNDLDLKTFEEFKKKLKSDES